MDNRKTLKIDSERLISELIKLSKVTYTPGRGVTRFSYTEKDEQIRDYLAEVADDYGFSYKTDKLGNVMIIPDGSRASLIMGSHIDTVRNGGWLDGIYGVLSGLEVLRTFAENDFAHDAALLIYAEEEGSVFGSTMTGSKFLAGVYGDDDLDLLKDDSGRTLRSHLEECGYIGPQTTSVHDVRLDFEKIRMMLETVMEQKCGTAGKVIVPDAAGKEFSCGIYLDRIGSVGNQAIVLALFLDCLEGETAGKQNTKLHAAEDK